MKNGLDGSCTSDSLSASDSTQSTITSSYRSPVTGSTASGRGVRKKTKDLPADLVDRQVLPIGPDAHMRHPQRGRVDIEDVAGWSSGTTGA